MSYKTLRTVTQLSREFPQYSESAIRGLIQKAASNGLEPVIVRVGKRVYLDEPKFVAWLFSK